MKIRNILNPPPQRFEGTKGTSMTVPEQSLTMRQIIDRQSRGLPVMASRKTPIYHGDETFIPDIKTLDLVDKQNMLRDARQTIDAANGSIKGAKTAKRKQAAAKAAAAKAEEQKASTNTP